MRYKLICLDVDGTLLNDEKRVPEPVKESLARAHDMGIEIALVTGRMPADWAASTMSGTPSRRQTAATSPTGRA